MPNKTKLSPNKIWPNKIWSPKLRLILAALCLTAIGAGLIAQTALFNSAKVSAQQNSANKNNASGQDNTAGQELQFARSAATERKFVELAEKARGGKPVRVIIGIRLPVAFRSEGLLKRQEDTDMQRTLIVQAQESLLNRLQVNNRESVKRFKYMPYLAMEVTAEELEQLKNSPEVFQIQEDVADKPSLVDSTRIVGADAAWASGFTGTGQTVAILDTGVDGTHPALNGKVVSEGCFSSTTTVSGVNFTSVCPGGVASSTAAGSGVNCPPGVDGCDHGTHVAGIAAGRAVALADGRTITGVARNANVIAIQVFSSKASDCDTDTAPCARSFVSDQISALERVQTLAQMTDGGGNPIFRIAAVNMSLGGGMNLASCDGDSRKTAIDNLRSIGIATVISSGNDGFNNAMGAPACISTAVSVGSTNKDDNVRASSNVTSFLSLFAPGGSIESSVPGGVFGFKSGTSMAAPHVAGAWAVFKASPGHGGDSVATVLTQFQNTGVPITDTRGPMPSNITRPRLRLDSALGLFSADLRLTKSGSPNPVIAGTNLTYTINLTNDGPDAAANVMVSDTLPANTTFVSPPAAAGWSCTFPAVGSGGQVKCTKASVANGETATFTFVVKVDDATPNGSNLNNTATVTTSDFDPNAANSTDTATTNVIAQADLEVISKADTPDPVITNNPLTYTITLRNNGPSVANSVELSDLLPFGAIFNSCVATGGGACSGSGQNRTVTFASLSVGATATVTFETTANCALADGAIINNTATISAATVDPNPANNSASASTLALNPPPMISCPTDRDVIALTPGSTTAIVNYPDPVVVDNCPGVTVVCVPASGSAFPLGATTVTCTATDSGGATASCSFTVTVWDASIQDEASGDYLLFNTFTGDYKYVRCGVNGFTMIGQGEIKRVGCTVTLHDDSRVNGSYDRCSIAPRNTGGATIKRLQPDTTFILKDRNILNNSPTCP